MLQARSIRKSYGPLLAVDGVSFEAAPGEIFGLLGPNGAGKTTILSILSGLLRPDAGSVEIGGFSLESEPRRAKQLLGVVPQDVTLYEELTARENLLFWGKIYGLGGAALAARVEDLLARGGLAAKAKAPVRTLSGGMKRRLNLLTGLVHDPRVLLLDEATVGIDPQGRIAILDLVRSVAAGGTAVVYTTHYLEEAEDLCRRVAILDHGRILAEGTVADLMRSAGEGEIVALSGSFTQEAIVASLEGTPGVRLIGAENGRALLSAALPAAEIFRHLDRILANVRSVEEISIRKPSLQSLFIKLTGREIRD